jgi:iron complex transport system substrate-binding protein
MMPTMTRRALLAGAAAALAAPSPARAESRWPVTVTDAIGRQVTIPKRPQAVILGTGFNLVALSLIHPDPISILAGWASDMKGDNLFIYDAFRKNFPAIEAVPLVGNGTADGLSFETALSLNADLAVMGRWQADTELGRRAIEYLGSVGVPTVVVDFNLDPLRSTPRDMRLLGRVLGQDEQAEAFARFYETRLERIRSRGAAVKDKGPLVLMDAFPSDVRGSWAIGRTGLGELIALAGARNVGASETLPPQGGPVTAEYIIAADPDVYIATGSPGGTYGAFSVGPGVDPAEARRTLGESAKMPNIAPLKAVREGRVHGLWNFFNAVPLNILAAEAVATWVRPELFADVDPAKSMAEINERFAAVPFDGAYWASL